MTRFLLLPLTALIATGCIPITLRFDFSDERAAVVPTPPERSVTEQRRFVELPLGDGTVLRGWYVQRSDARRTVLWFYGAGHSLANGTDTLTWLSDTFEANALALDMRGCGYSDGRYDFRASLADSVRIYDFLTAHLSPPGLPVVVVGHSMGTSLATHVARARRVDGLVLMAPLSSLQDVVDSHVPWVAWPFFRFRVTRAFSARPTPLEELQGVSAPLVVLHGDDDWVVPWEIGRRMYLAAGSRQKTFCRVRGGGHSVFMPSNLVVQRCLDRFAATLAAAPAPVQGALSARP